MRYRLFRIFWLFSLLVVGAACSTTQSAGPQGMQGAMEAEPLADYRLRCGDSISIDFFYHPELDETTMIRPDGKISLKLIDEVLVAGLTTAQLVQVLTKEYDNYLENFTINVVVREYSGLRAFVGGEVGRAGFVPLRGNMTALQAVFASGGFRDTAKAQNVILIRKGLDDRPMARIIDLKSVMSGEQMENDVYLMASDIVYVPKTWIAEAGVFVNQYLRRVFFVDTILTGVGYALGYKWVWQGETF